MDGHSRRKIIALPLGYDRLHAFQKTQSHSQRLKSLPEIKPGFDPVDSSLLIQDSEGFELVQKLKTRVGFIEKTSKLGILDLKSSSGLKYRNRNSLLRTVMETILKPSVIKIIAEKTQSSLGKTITMKPISENSINSILAQMKGQKPNCVQKSFERLYYSSQNNPTSRDKHCFTRESLHSDSKRPSLRSALNGSITRSPSKKALNHGPTIELKRSRKLEFDPNRLPYMYMCPSI